MNLLLKKIFIKVRMSLFPSEQEKQYKKWVVEDGEKLRFDYNLNSNSLVIDLGGYKGEWASDIYARYNCRILIFEPVKSFENNIRKRFKINNKIKVFRLALGANRRKEVIALCADGTSMYRNSSKKEMIQFEDVYDFFVKNKINHVDLMKINIEGGEYELLPRLIETGLIKKIKDIQIQFHNVEPNSEVKMKEILSKIELTHTPTYKYKFVWENWRRRL